MEGKREVSRRAAPEQWVVANPRGIPPGRYILHHQETGPDGDVRHRYWFEGDVYDGPVTERFVRDGFIVKEAARG